MKKVLSLVLVLTLVLGSFSFAFADNAQPTDNDRVNKLIELGLVLGDAGGYRLNDTITRAEAAVMVVKAQGLESVANASKYASSFKDVPANHWALGFINVVAGRGIVSGYPDGTFRPDANISYAEIITMMVQVLGGLTEQEAKAPWPANYITKASNLGILEDVSVANFAEIAVRERVFEIVYNTIINNKIGDFEQVKAIVLENYRVESIGENQIVVEVIRELQRAEYTKESRAEKGDQLRLTLPASVGDVEDLLGKVIDVAFDKSDKAVSVKVDSSYDYITGDVEAYKDTLYVNGRKYTVATGERYNTSDERIFRTYYNNDALQYVEFYQNPDTKVNKDEFAAEFAKVTIKNGKVLFVDAFNFTDIAPVQEVKKDGAEVFVYDDKSDGATKKVVLNSDAFIIEVDSESKAVKVSDKEKIDADQVIHYILGSNGKAETVFVRTDAKLTGKYEKARSSTIDGVTSTNLYIDGDVYTALTASGYLGRKAVYTYNSEKYSTLEGATSFAIDQVLNPYKDKDVLVLLDMNDNIQFISADVKATYFVGMLTKVLGTEVEIAKADETEDVYKVTMKSELNAGTGSHESRLTAFEPGDLVRVELDDNENIATMDKLVRADGTLSANWKNIAQEGIDVTSVVNSMTKGEIKVNGIEAYITKETLVFVDTSNETRGITMTEVMDKYVTKLSDGSFEPVAFVAYDAIGSGENVAKVIVFTTLNKKVADTKKLEVKVVNHEYYGGDNYLTVVDNKGTETTHKYVGARAKLTGLAGSDIITLTVRKSDETVATDVYQVIDASDDAVYEVTKVEEGGRKLTLKDADGTSVVLWKSINAVEFGNVGVGEKVMIAVDANNRITHITTTTRGLTTPVTPPSTTDVVKQIASDRLSIVMNGRVYKLFAPLPAGINEEDKITYDLVDGLDGTKWLSNVQKVN